MTPFFDRQAELRELDTLFDSGQAQLLLVYGRRRVGKTTLLLRWAERTEKPFIYWVARREGPDAARQGLAQAVWRWAYPEAGEPGAPRFETWPQLFEQIARMVGDRQLILLLDEVPYAVESDPSLPSHLQAAWDHLFQAGNMVVALAGSHIGMMVDLFRYQAPLYGRFTAQLGLEALPFAALADFFPRYTPAERVATWAVLGGVPAYLQRFDRDKSLSANIRRHLFQRIGMFRSEPTVLLSDLVRETRGYEAVLRAIAGGGHTPAEIGARSQTSSPNLAPYLKRLGELGLTERRLPATVPPAERQGTTRSRYYLRDPYLRFYFRFIEPNLELIEQGLSAVLWERIGEQFRAFVGATAFEDLCREWTVTQAQQRRLPLAPEVVGSHWSRDAQVDVVAVNWRDRKMLLGECRWGARPVGQAVLRELRAKAGRVVPGDDWQVFFALFSRSGFTAATRAAARESSAILVDLETLDTDLRRALEEA